VERLSEAQRLLQRAYNQSMHRIMKFLLVMAALPLTTPLTDARETAVSPGELAARADLVALVQVRDTDYLTRRNIPVSGSAYLMVLIPYKPNPHKPRTEPIDRTTGLIEVYEKGLHGNACYFPNPDVTEEGRRFLVFLKRDPENPERFRGMPEGCALDVLVAADNGYVLRYPLTGIALSGSIGDLARETAFSDGYAVVDDDELPPEQRNAMLSAGQIRPYPEGRWIYTMGIDMAAFRALMEQEVPEP